MAKKDQRLQRLEGRRELARILADLVRNGYLEVEINDENEAVFRPRDKVAAAGGGPDAA